MILKQHFNWLAMASLMNIAILAPSPASGQMNAQAIRNEVRAYRGQNEIAILRELSELLAIPNVAADKENIERNAVKLQAMLEKRGFRTELLRVEGASPAVFGELRSPGAARTIMAYMHYDGQPVNPENWSSDPWQPILRDKALESGGREQSLDDLRPPVSGEARLYARSASDDKSPILAMLAAIDALQASQIPRSVNLKFFLEGEEEAGSTNLAEILAKYAQQLQADIWLFCDGPVHQTRRPQVVFGVRGVTGVRMTVYGPNRPLHSGHYGNWAPNPIGLLVNLMASMRDVDGKILIAGFYDDVRPISPSERAALQESPNIDERMRVELGLAWSEGAGRLEEQIMLPAINFRGIGSGGPQARNAIQTSATAAIGLRLVPNQTITKVRERFEGHIRAQGFHIVYDEPDSTARLKHRKIVRLQWGGGYEPLRTSMDLPAARALIKSIEETIDDTVIQMPTAGGSLPLFIFEQVLHAPVIIVPMVNHDNNQHAENESLRIQNLWDGIEMYAGILARAGLVWE